MAMRCRKRIIAPLPVPAHRARRRAARPRVEFGERRGCRDAPSAPPPGASPSAHGDCREFLVAGRDRSAGDRREARLDLLGRRQMARGPRGAARAGLEEALHDAVFERVEGHGDEASAGFQARVRPRAGLNELGHIRRSPRCAAPERSGWPGSGRAPPHVHGRRVRPVRPWSRSGSGRRSTMRGRMARERRSSPYR